jgi:DNA-binding transcriptional ArsR family regulator
MSRAAAEQDVFRAVADESLRTILEALAERPHSFQELQALLTISKGTVSQHLAILVAVGLVSSSVEGRQHHYALVPEPLQEIDDWVNRFRPCWTIYLEGLSESMRRAAAARRARRAPSA